MERQARLSELDLNLLLVFDQLVRQRSVSIAAEVMNVSQPAVSNALKRLRDLLGDKLFVRGPSGMEPTSRALQLAEPVAYALSSLEQALKHQEKFDAQVDSRNFSLALAEFDSCIIPPLVSILEQKKAKIEFTFVARHGAPLKDALENGLIDLAFGNLPQLEANFYKKRLFRVGFVLVMRKGHQLAEKRQISREDLAEVEQVSMRPAQGNPTELESMLEGVHRGCRVRVDTWGMVGTVLQNSDMVATVPERLAKRLAEPFDLECRKHPVELPERPLEMYWHERVHRDPGVRWLRSVILELFGED